MERYKSLDSLRGIAALFVLFSHYTYLYDVIYGYKFDYLNLKYLGGVAVQIFFILSGFLIYYSIIKSNSGIEFLKKRFIRLYPSYWTCLTITFVTVFIFGLPTLQVSFRDALFGLTMLPQLFGALKVDNSYWTLVPEFFFYVMMYVLFVSKKVDKIHWLAPTWLLLSLFHIHVYHLKGIGLLLNLDYSPCFLAGILVQNLKDNHKQYLLWIYFLLCFLLRISLDDFDIYSSISTFFVFSLFIVFVFSELTFLQNKVFLYFGVISYPLYLIHQNIGFIIINYTVKYFDNLLVIVLPTLVSIGLATIITLCIEKPAMAYLRNKLL